jgi:hypothetical protein
MASGPNQGEPAAAPAPPKRAAGPVLLGAFIVWQLTYLLFGNLLGLLGDSRPDVDELTEGPYYPKPGGADGQVREAVNLLTGLCVRWGEVTGQAQRWSLFAPRVPAQGVFLTVELRWSAPAERVVRLPSPFEPAGSLPHFLPLPDRDRAYNYEARLGLVAAAWDEHVVSEYPEEWRAETSDRVRTQWKSLRAYLRQRLREFQHAHPGTPPPAEVVLLARVYRIPPPAQAPWAWEGPRELPLARWRPAADPPPAGWLPVEAYDPQAHDFVRLPAEDRPPHE